MLSCLSVKTASGSEEEEQCMRTHCQLKALFFCMQISIAADLTSPHPSPSSVVGLPFELPPGSSTGVHIAPGALKVWDIHCSLVFQTGVRSECIFPHKTLWHRLLPPFGARDILRKPASCESILIPSPSQMHGMRWHYHMYIYVCLMSLSSTHTSSSCSHFSLTKSYMTPAQK